MLFPITLFPITLFPIALFPITLFPIMDALRRLRLRSNVRLRWNRCAR
jgi:hypothetical protein